MTKRRVDVTNIIEVMPFRRYTNLAAAIHLLRKKTITLLSPATWDDRNDAFCMAEYQRILGFKTALALCFAESNEDIQGQTPIYPIR
jgi:hypothetical protein